MMLQGVNRLVFVGLVAALAGALGCARGASGIKGTGQGATEDGGTTDSGAQEDSGGGAVDSGTELDSGASKDAGGGSDAGDETDAGPMCSMAPNTCATARAISNVKGDQGMEVSTAGGTGSEWIQLIVTDTEGVGTNQPMGAAFVLTSPAGANYDLFVYQPTPSGGKATAPKDCGVAPKSSQNTVGDDSVTLSWNDDQNFIGETAGDGLVISVEVRHISGDCGAWSLTVTGNP